MQWLSILQIVGGIVVTVLGAELLVRGASRLARRLGISPLVVGLTVVALGTSAPEIAISVLSTVRGQADLAVGNVLGSNTFNVLAVLGLSAAITPLAVGRRIVQLEVPLLIGVNLAVLAMAAGGAFERWEGIALLSAVAAYTVFLVRRARRESEGEPAGDELPKGVAAGVPWNVILFLVGLALLAGGAHVLVLGASELARALGVSELIVGLTVIAAGTSLPELATSAVAAWRGERDIAVGNVMGSCLFNLLAVLGLAAALAPQPVPVDPSALRFDFPVMVVAAISCLPFLATGHRIDRWEGFVWVGFYVAYVAALVLRAVEHRSALWVEVGMLVLAVPLLGITLAVVVWRALRARARPASAG